MQYTAKGRRIFKAGVTHPDHEVLVILEKPDNEPEFWTGWVANFAGQVYPYHTLAGNGDLMGDVTWVRANTDSAGKHQSYVLEAQLAQEYYQALILGIDTLAREIRELGQLSEDSQAVRQLLLVWSDLADDEIAGIINDQLGMDDLLRGARDQMKAQAAQKIHSAQGVKDSRGRLNPGATAVKHISAEPLVQARIKRAQGSLANLTSRLPGAERMISYLEVRSAQLDEYLRQHPVITAADVEEFYNIGRDSLKPLNQLVNWLCLKLDEGGGQILYPHVTQIAQRGLAFGRLYGRIVRVLRPISSLSLVQAQASSQRYQQAFGPEVERLRLLLARWRGQVGGPFDELVEQLYQDSCSLALGLELPDWLLVIARAKAMRHTLVYRSTPDDPAPDVWYGHTPPGSNPVELAATYNRLAHPINQASIPADPLEGLPTGPRG